MTSVAYAALWIFIFSLPWDVLGSSGGVAVVARLTGALALGCALMVVVVSGRFRRIHQFHRAAFLFVAWAGLLLLLFSKGQKLPSKYFTFVQLCVAAWIIWELARSRRQLLGLLIAYVLGAYVAALDTLLLYRREAGKLLRFTAGDTDPNDLAMTLALALPMAWYLGMNHRHGLVRWICRGYMALGILAVALTGSRGGMLATTVALLIVPLTMARLTPGRLAVAIVLLAGAAGLAVAYVPDTIVQRLGTTGMEVEDANFGNRGPIWKAGFHAFGRRPIMGYGTSGFRQAITPEMGSRSQVAHNSFLSVLVEQGIVGLILYLVMIVTVFRSVLHLPTLERRFALTLLATLMIAMLPLTWEDSKPVWFILAALLGLSHAPVSRGGEIVRPPDPSLTRQAPGPRAGGRARGPLTARAERDAAP